MMSDICDFSCVWNSDIKQNIHGVMDSIVDRLLRSLSKDRVTEYIDRVQGSVDRLDDNKR